jgi:hypothetical protein
LHELVAVLSVGWVRFRDGFSMAVVKTATRPPRGIAEYVAWVRNNQRSTSTVDADPINTASTAFDRGLR